MTGAPREVYASQDFIIVSKAAVRALGNWELAGCFQRIAWRCERDGYWRAQMADIAEEICVSERTAHRLTKKLREMGWVSAEREVTWESTLTWRVIWSDQTANLASSSGDDKTAGQAPEGQPDTDENANVAVSGPPNVAPSQAANLAGSQNANLAASPSSQTVETVETSEDSLRSSADAITQPTLTLVAADGASSTPTIGKSTRADVERVCAHLADRIVENGSKRPTITQKWRDAARLLMDNDHKSEQQVHNMIDWCQSNEFWRSNILSMPTLREKYEQMRLQAVRSVNGRAGSAHVSDQNTASAQRRRSVLG